MAVLADTCVWIDFFRSSNAVGDELERLLKTDSVWTCGIVIFELLQGIISDRERTLIKNILLNLHYIEMSQALWQKAADISTKIRKKGHNIPMSDILIATVAIEYDLWVFTVDTHFKKIPGVKLYTL